MKKIEKMQELLSKASELIEAEDISSEELETEENRSKGCVIIAISNNTVKAMITGDGATTAVGIGRFLIAQPRMCSMVLEYILQH